MSKPTSVTTRPISESDKHIIAEHDAIRAGIADVTLAWGALETELAYLLSAVLKADPELGGAIYFSPASAEVRVGIVDAALKQIVARHAVQAALLPKWASIINTMKHLRKTRNKVAHGTISHFHPGGESASYARLVDPMLKDDMALAKAMSKRQKPGMGSNELKESVIAVHQLRSRVHRFRKFVQLFHAGDIATLLQKLGKAEA